ncbi:VOC domain-containing protein [Heracleum sosnowskyi]|uniref:VOC domain-containing protein n=1 Tax=Heracleum sosnowskyi TaxID=360622 RepID=A0AAD8HYH6_9APIA|nr:VOC domain-containing protein [Heracleum sosnowskyi]
MGQEIENGEVEKMLDRVSSSTKHEMPLLALNHVSYVCKSLATSVKFYEDVLGFLLVKRPSSFDFEGAWLFNHGIGIHLLEVKNALTNKGQKINPKDNHISFQCTNMDLIIRQLETMNIEYVTAVVSEGGVMVDQLFFHDPDGYMIEICNCQNLPILPLSALPSCPIPKSTSPNKNLSTCGKMCSEGQMCREVEASMMENLVVGMMDLYF